jgi:hypothetical protein
MRQFIQYPAYYWLIVVIFSFSFIEQVFIHPSHAVNTVVNIPKIQLDTFFNTAVV